MPQDSNAIELPLCGTSVLAPKQGVSGVAGIGEQLRELGAHVTEVDAGELPFELYPRWAKCGGERLMLWPLAPDANACVPGLRDE